MTFTSCQLDRLIHRYLCVATADFFNGIDPIRTYVYCGTSFAESKLPSAALLCAGMKVIKRSYAFAVDPYATVSLQEADG